MQKLISFKWLLHIQFQPYRCQQACTLTSRWKSKNSGMKIDQFLQVGTFKNWPIFRADFSIFIARSVCSPTNTYGAEIKYAGTSIKLIIFPMSWYLQTYVHVFGARLESGQVISGKCKKLPRGQNYKKFQKCPYRCIWANLGRINYYSFFQTPKWLNQTHFRDPLYRPKMANFGSVQ